MDKGIGALTPTCEPWDVIMDQAVPDSLVRIKFMRKPRYDQSSGTRQTVSLSVP